MAGLVHISVRVESEVRDHLDAIVKKRRMEAGDDVRLADVIRDALQEYIERNK